MATANKAAAKSAPRVKLGADAPSESTPRKRVAIKDDDQSSGQASTYFTNIDERTDIKFVRSGCPVLDAALGGGWPLGRVVNIVGDKSAGKTLLAIEACANFDKLYPDGYIRYNEAEAAFDEKYAEALGMPAGRVDFKGLVASAEDEAKHAELKEQLGDRDASEKDKERIERAMRKLEGKGAGRAKNTVEFLYDDIVHTLDTQRNRPILYIIDSLDALSDDAESDRGIGDASYGGSKPKKLGEMFRRLVDRMEEQDMLLIVISQLRDKLNVTFGEKQTRSGGRALDFYATHIVWLAEIGKIKKTISGVDRVIGVNVRARVKKNKVGLPFRECDYPILFGYGVDDLTACVEWLIEVSKADKLDEVGLSKAGYKVSLPNIRNKGGPPARELREQLTKIVWREWQAIETGFLPKSRKY